MIPVFTPGKWTIIFHDNGTKPEHWWDLFTRPGFRHVYALRYLQPLDAWVMVDWSNVGLAIEFLPKRFVDALILGVNAHGGRFLDVEVKAAPRRLIPFVPLYCVSAMKELIGLRSWKVITPYQLYCALMKTGAKRIFNLSHLMENTNGRKSEADTIRS